MRVLLRDLWDGRSRRARRVPSWWAECRLTKKLVRRAADTVPGMLAEAAEGWQGTAEPPCPESPGCQRGESRQERVAAGNPAVGRSGGSPRGTEQGHSPPAGLAAPFALGGGTAPHPAVPSAVTLQAREGHGAGEGNLSFQWQTVPPFCLMFLSPCVHFCVEGWSLLLHPSLSLCQRAAGRAQAGMLLGFLEGSVPLGGTKKLR